ncbi:sulfatase-like hydrolase/transferase [Thalassolituus sp. LLYu03]|uniref:phosphoethanolamine transferase n=1 Tax=Thalassolituus sp. LLYu03 TaxID=3421656 RepID=UPI003D2E6740
MTQDVSSAVIKEPMFHLKFPRAPLFWIALLLLFPLALELTYSDFVREGEYNSRIGWSFILATVAYLLPKRGVIAFLLLPFAIGGSLDIGYAVSFGGVFTTATLEAVAYTDSSEASEFIAAYASIKLTLWLILYWGLYGLGVYAMRPKEGAASKTRRITMVLGFILMAVVAYRTTIMARYHDTIPGVLGSIPSYLHGSVSLQDEFQLRKTMLLDTKVTASISKAGAQTHIFIIGESASRNHMGVYGYHRNTTPFLSSIERQSVIFRNVISSHAQTQASLRAALTATDASQGDKFREAFSVIDIANMAGYETWWISNQQPLRATIASIAHQADHAYYISNDFNGVEVNRYDTYMLKRISEALANPAEHKAIFIHMMGSHAQYKNRYPDEFDVFRDSKVKAYTAQPGSNVVDAINEYDNSILFTDFFLQQVFALVKETQQDALATITYFSDHGEEVYQQANLKGHSPDNLTANMFEIPFVFWSSDQQEIARYREHQNSPFMLDSFYHYASKVMAIESDSVLPESSLVDDHYQPPAVRMVYKTSYDTQLRTDQPTD